MRKIVVVRFLPILLLLAITAPACALAQVQERKLVDRLLKPDLELENRSFERAFSTGGSYRGTGEARVKEYRYVDKFTTKSVSTRDFAGPKSHWSGDYKFESKDARVTSRNSLPEIKPYRVKDVDVENARESGKIYGTKAFAGRSETTMRGKSQKELDHRYRDPEPLTIDQVRELLNKTQ